MNRLCPLTGTILFKKNTTFGGYSPTGQQARIAIVMEKEDPEYVDGKQTGKKIKRHHRIFVAVSKDALKKEVDYKKLFNEIVCHSMAGRICVENGFKPVGYEKR